MNFTRGLAADLRVSVRTLLKQRAFTVAVLLTLTTAVGANVAIFTFVYGVLLQPLPYAEADRIVRLRETNEGHGAGISTLTYLDWKSENRVFDYMAADANNPVTLTGIAEPVQLRSNQVTAEFFEVFGIRAALGRTFLPGDDQPGRPLVAVISNAFWRAQFGADPQIIGRSILLDDQPHTVIGVLPGGTAIDRSYHQLWRPLRFTEQNRTRNYHWLSAVARLKPGVSLEQARANMAMIAARIAVDYPETNKTWGVRVSPFKDGVASGQLRRGLTLLMIAAAVVLLIAGVNVANLFLARGLARQREIATRLTLGASRVRLIRQIATEGGVLCIAGSLLGLFIGVVLVQLVNAVLPFNAVPAEADISLNLPVLLFTAGVMFVTTFGCAVLPAVRITRANVSLTLHQRDATGGAAQIRLNGIFVVVQVALALALVATAGLLVRSIAKLHQVDPGVDMSNVLTARLPIPEKRFATSDALLAHLRQISERVASLPRVRDVAFTIALPLDVGGYGMGFQIAGTPVVDAANRPFTFFKPVAPSYFKTLGLRSLRGRVLGPHDTKNSPPVAVVNDAFAQKYFPNRDPLGEHVLIRAVLFGKLGLGDDIAWQVAGIVSNERVSGLDNDEREPIVYVSQEQAPQSISQVLVVRGDIAPALLEKHVRDAIHSVAPDQVLSEVRTLVQLKREQLGPRRFQTSLLVGFASVAALLATIGIYGVLAYTVEQRQRELGIRSALGASRAQLLRHVLTRGMSLVGIGCALGLILTLAANRLMTAFLYGVSPSDPMSLGLGLVLLSAAAWLACYLPARRAANVDPIICLRSE